MRIECWLPKDTVAHLEHVILTAFPQKQSMVTRTNFSLALCVTCLTCLTHFEVSTRTSILASQLACQNNSHSSLNLLSEILVAVDWHKLTFHSCQFSTVFHARPYCTRVSFCSTHRLQTNEVACEFSYASGATCKRYWHSAIGASK